jgi:hypothetical protein
MSGEDNPSETWQRRGKGSGTKNEGEGEEEAAAAASAAAEGLDHRIMIVPMSSEDERVEASTKQVRVSL